MSNVNDWRELKVGDRVCFTHIIERYPFFSIPAGVLGTVRYVDPKSGCDIEPDGKLAASMEWDDCICWYVNNGPWNNDDMTDVRDIPNVLVKLHTTN